MDSVLRLPARAATPSDPRRSQPRAHGALRLLRARNPVAEPPVMNTVTVGE